MIEPRKTAIIGTRPMITLALISMVVTQANAPTLGQEPSLSMGRTWVRQLYSGQSPKLWKRGGDGLKRQFRSPAALQGFARKLTADFGNELRVMSEGLAPQGPLTAYRRTAVFSRWARGVELELLFDQAGRAVGFSARRASGEAPTTSGARKTQALLRLPVEGPWQVLWGGRRWEDNRHASVSDMRYALDLLITRGGSSSTGAGTKNEHYHCWDQLAVAPADGIVVAARDGIADNAPNRANPESLYGNFVVIDHGTGEYSLLGHLKKGSVGVRVGDRVAQGHQLARVGNSGMSTEPHLHYQLMNKPDWLVAEGLPAQFRSFLRNGSLVDRGEPRRGETIEHASTLASRDPEPPQHLIR